MARTVILYADTGIAMSELANVFISVLHAPSTMPRLREMRGHLARARTKWSGASCGLTVLGANSFVLDLSSEIRDESAALSRDHPSVASTIVVESTGFAGSALRAFLSSLALLSRSRGKVHGSVAEGAAWLAPAAGAAARMDITAAQLAGAVEETRAAIRQR